MNNDKNQPAKTTNEVANVSTKKDYLDASNISRIENLVEALKDSTLAKQFVEESWEYDEDGNKIEGTCVTTFNKADMIMCLGLGESLGLNPFEALSYGSRLNISVIKKVTIGERLGLDFATSMSQIYIRGEGTKEIVYTSIHVVNMVLTRVGVIRETIQDGTIPQNKCIVYTTGKIEDYDSSIHKVLPTGMDNNTLDSVVKGLIDKGSIPVTKIPTYYVVEVKLTRYNKVAKEKESVTTKYTTQQAIDAGLLKGINSWGESVKGKDNWNSHTITHLYKMCIMIGGRTIASDALHGIYIGDEISIIKNTTSNERTDFEEAEIIPN